MAAFLVHIRSLLFFICLVQSVSLYKIFSSNNELPDLSSSSLNSDINAPIQAEYNAFDEEHPQAARSILPIQVQPKQPRRNNRPHWNPLVAAYRRCGGLVRTERESCFKDAVQMLFVHNIRK